MNPDETTVPAAPQDPAQATDPGVATDPVSAPIVDTPAVTEEGGQVAETPPTAPDAEDATAEAAPDSGDASTQTPSDAPQA